jgi:hypothetical protein
MHGLFLYVPIAYPKPPVSAFGQPFQQRQLQDFPRLDPPDFLGMGPPDFLGMDPPNFLGMGPPAGAASRARRRAFLHAAAASGAERRCSEAMHFRG